MCLKKISCSVSYKSNLLGKLVSRVWKLSDENFDQGVYGPTSGGSLHMKILEQKLKLPAKMITISSAGCSHCPKLTVKTRLTLHYAPQLYRQVLLRRVLAMGILSVRPSVRLSVRLSQPGGIPRPGEIETPGLHHMIA